MSASEKLRTLLSREQWRSHDATVLAGLALTVEEALPQIVAVVEAAELLRHEATTIHNPEYPSTLKSNHAAATALAALDETLGEQ